MSSQGPYGRHGFTAPGSATTTGSYGGGAGYGGGYGAAAPQGYGSAPNSGGDSYTAPSPQGGGYTQQQSYASGPNAPTNGGYVSNVFGDERYCICIHSATKHTIKHHFCTCSVMVRGHWGHYDLLI